MPDPYPVKPDREFLHRILDEGGENVKKCFQCATCSVVCNLSTGENPFPRKEMIWAQWGLKDRLMADPDVWRCHQCNDCSTKCPRGARPGDVLAAIRQQTVQHYAVPQVLAQWLSQVKYLPLVLLAPVILMAMALAARGLLGKSSHYGFFAELFPHWLLIAFFSTITTAVAAGVVMGVWRFWQGMKAADEASGGYKPVLGLVPSVINTVKAILTHEKFGQCTTQASRRMAHLLVFYGFLALFIVTIWAVIDLYLNPLIGIKAMYPFDWMHPMKILANLGTIALIAGCVMVIRDRLKNEEEYGGSTLFDWTFVGLLLAVAVTGFLTQIFRFAADPHERLAEMTALGNVAFTVYFVHLVLVFDLLVYLPYSKFAHIVYRTVALVYSEHTGRDGKTAEEA
ncbi:MAG: quinone-interacting membrane-bound oxidoreductase complex subunit QmoC [Planctomycetes bacterium]|nr:quinone-interacting membrane-bound oxidoreductase complex subunit QmoC [Planctomycetota bacterium]